MPRWFVVMVAVLVSFVTMASSPRDTSDTTKTDAVKVRTKFDPNAVLTAAELQTVVELAQQCGLPNVAEVSTHNMHPSSFYCIGAKSRETIFGREVSFVTVTINSEKLGPKRMKSRSKVLKSNGDFWVEQGYVQSVRLTIFDVGGKTIRAKVFGGIPLPIAESVVAAFAGGKIRFGTDELKKKYERYDFSEPNSVGIEEDGKLLGVGFRFGEYGGLNVNITLDGEWVTITDVLLWMS